MAREFPTIQPNLQKEVLTIPTGTQRKVIIEDRKLYTFKFNVSTCAGLVEIYRTEEGTYEVIASHFLSSELRMLDVEKISPDLNNLVESDQVSSQNQGASLVVRIWLPGPDVREEYNFNNVVSHQKVFMFYGEQNSTYDPKLCSSTYAVDLVVMNDHVFIQVSS